MENFKKRVLLRTQWMAMIIIVLAVTNFTLMFNEDKLPAIPDFIKGFQSGAFCGVELVLVFFIAKNLASLRDEKKLKKLYIEENDERTIAIMQKTGALGFTISTIGLAFSTVVAGFFNQSVFFSLLGATVFTALIKGFFKLYYHHKL